MTFETEKNGFDKNRINRKLNGLLIFLSYLNFETHRNEAIYHQKIRKEQFTFKQ